MPSPAAEPPTLPDRESCQILAQLGVIKGWRPWAFVGRADRLTICCDLPGVGANTHYRASFPTGDP